MHFCLISYYELIGLIDGLKLTSKSKLNKGLEVNHLQSRDKAQFAIENSIRKKTAFGI